jgi:hypothetical protein
MRGGVAYVVIVATGYRLNGPEVKCRFGCDFSYPSRPAFSHSVSYTMGTGSFPEVELS